RLLTIHPCNDYSNLLLALTRGGGVCSGSQPLSEVQDRDQIPPEVHHSQDIVLCFGYRSNGTHRHDLFGQRNVYRELFAPSSEYDHLSFYRHYLSLQACRRRRYAFVEQRGQVRPAGFRRTRGSNLSRRLRVPSTLVPCLLVRAP